MGCEITAIFSKKPINCAEGFLCTLIRIIFLAGFEVSTKISRKAFGLKWDALTEAGGAVVADEVRIHANVQYSKVEVAEMAEA